MHIYTIRKVKESGGLYLNEICAGYYGTPPYEFELLADRFVFLDDEYLLSLHHEVEEAICAAV